MGHSGWHLRTCRRYTAIMTVVLLVFGSGTLQAQAAIEMGAAFQRVHAYQQRFDFSGYSIDLSVRTSRVANLIFRFQKLSHNEDAPVDPMQIASLEGGFQFLPMRGRQVQLAIGMGLGGYIRPEYDAATSGVSFFGQARVNWYPFPAAGLYVEALGRSFGGYRGGQAVGLTLGVSLGTNH